MKQFKYNNNSYTVHCANGFKKDFIFAVCGCNVVIINAEYLETWL